MHYTDRDLLMRDFEFMNAVIGIGVDIDHLDKIQEIYDKDSCYGFYVCFHCGLEENDDDIDVLGDSQYVSFEKTIIKENGIEVIDNKRFKETIWYKHLHFCNSLQNSGITRIINKHNDDSYTTKKTWTHFILEGDNVCCNYDNTYFIESHPRQCDFTGDDPVHGNPVSACGYFLLKVKTNKHKQNL